MKQKPMNEQSRNEVEQGKRLWRQFLIIIISIIIGAWVLVFLLISGLAYDAQVLFTFFVDAVIAVIIAVYYKRLFNNYWGILLGLLSFFGVFFFGLLSFFSMGLLVALLIFYLQYRKKMKKREKPITNNNNGQ